MKHILSVMTSCALTVVKPGTDRINTKPKSWDHTRNTVCLFKLLAMHSKKIQVCNDQELLVFTSLKIHT